jgi:hypothetical protein
MVVLDRIAATSSETGEFRVTRIDLAGDTVWSRSFLYAPVPIPRSQVDSIVQRTAADFYGTVGEVSGITPARWEDLVAEAIYAPPFFPPVDRLGIGMDGTVWVRLRQPDPERSDWLVLDLDGEPIARVELPAGFEWMTANRNTIWGTERDELDVPYIVRYRLTG